MRWAWRGPGRERGHIVDHLWVIASPEAAPSPIFGSLDHVGAHRVAFDVSRDLEEVFVVLNGEGFVGALVDVPAAGGVSVLVVAADVRDGEALHVSAQVSGFTRPKD